MSNKKKTQHRKHPPRANQPSRAKQPPKSHHVAAKKERGGWLTAAIIFVILHGFLVLAGIYGDSLFAVEELPPAWIIYSLVGLAIADIVAGVALWKWKSWGFYLYLFTSIAVIGLGILATGYAMLWTFSRILPFVILGYIMRPKWKFFD